MSLELDKVAERLKEHNLILTATPAALSALADQGYDAEFGARPLRRVIQRELEDTLSERILFNELRPGQTVVVDCAGDPEGLVFRPAEKEVPVG